MRFDEVVPQLERALDILRAEARSMDQQLLALTAASKSASQGEVARKKPGRKPKLIAKAMTMAPDESSTKKRKKPQWSEEARRAAAERSRRMWEARRKAQS